MPIHARPEDTGHRVPRMKGWLASRDHSLHKGHKRPGRNEDPLSWRTHGRTQSPRKSEKACCHGRMLSYFGSFWVPTRTHSFTEPQPASSEPSCAIGLTLGL